MKEPVEPIPYAVSLLAAYPQPAYPSAQLHNPMPYRPLSKIFSIFYPLFYFLHRHCGGAFWGDVIGVGLVV